MRVPHRPDFTIDRHNGLRRAAARAVSVMVMTLTLTAACLGLSTAANAQAALTSPEAAKGIALGLIDATGPLAVQCGLGKIGEKIKAKSVATAAVRDSLAISGAKKSCSGVKELAEAIGVIAAATAIDQPVYISLKQSEKNKWWGLGVVKTCTVKLRVGASEQIAKTFTANFTCH